VILTTNWLPVLAHECGHALRLCAKLNPEPMGSFSCDGHRYDLAKYDKSYVPGLVLNDSSDLAGQKKWSKADETEA